MSVILNQQVGVLSTRECLYNMSVYRVKEGKRLYLSYVWYSYYLTTSLHHVLLKQVLLLYFRRDKFVVISCVFSALILPSGNIVIFIGVNNISALSGSLLRSDCIWWLSSHIIHTLIFCYNCLSYLRSEDLKFFFFVIFFFVVVFIKITLVNRDLIWVEQ